MTTSDITIKYSNSDFALDVNFPLPTQGISGLFGPSGSGKTTLIRCLAGLERPHEAHIQVGNSLWQSDDIFLPPHKRRVGLVFQDVRLFGHLNVQGNLLFGHKRTPVEDRKISFDDVLDILDLSPLLKKRPENLSGGEAQRVAIGRALLTSPALLLMDEPLAALGEQHKKDILPYLRKIPQNFGIPMLYVSHDFNEMASLTRDIIVLQRGEIHARGRIEDIAAKLPDVMAQWTPDNIITGQTDEDGNVTLSDGQVIERILPSNSKTSPNNATNIILNARDITLLPAIPEQHSGIALLTGNIQAIQPMSKDQMMVTLSVSGQEVQTFLAHNENRPSWLDPSNDVHLIINRIKLETD